MFIVQTAVWMRMLMQVNLQREFSAVEETDLPDFDALNDAARRDIILKTIADVIISRVKRNIVDIDINALTGENKKIYYDTWRYKEIKKTEI